MIDTSKRSFARSAEQTRPVAFTSGYIKDAYGSCLVAFGDTKVLCVASISQEVAGWRKDSHLGWLTAEYAMLPGSTVPRTKREYGMRKGRSQEIERLIGRSLRSCVDMHALGESTVTIDCDVLQADGGTRTASICGGWVALHDALETWRKAGKVKVSPLIGQVAAVSVGQVAGRMLCDLDYQEDSHAEVDMNIVQNGQGEFIEVQGTGEGASFSRSGLDQMLDLADAAIKEIMALQKAAVA
ncbi:MAG: ribonuclease PH [Coriobacteriales bacterium]|jgi:ribonuclease PH|nr:ribonuclease PH [Coriobacteriales bacterium]